MTPEPIPVSNFKDFVAEVGKLENRHWVFRGHGRVGWQIESSLARYLRSHQRNILKTSFDPREAGSIQTFRKSAHLFLNHLPDRKDTLSWLAVMQHFGAPTRIIDFTFSPYVALFFAASEAAPKIDWGENPTNIDGKYESFEVHAIQQRAIRDQAAKVLGISDDPWAAITASVQGVRSRRILSVSFKENGKMLVRPHNKGCSWFRVK